MEPPSPLPWQGLKLSFESTLIEVSSTAGSNAGHYPLPPPPPPPDSASNITWVQTKISGAKHFTVVQWKPALREPILNGQFFSLPDEKLKIFPTK